MASIRAATPRDGVHIARHQYFRLDARQDDLRAYGEWVADELAKGTYIGFLAEANGQVIAGAGVLVLNGGPTKGNRNPLHARIVNVYVFEKFRRKGVAFDLIDRILGACRMQGITRFSVTANNDSKKLFEAAGFEFVENEMFLEIA
jgi:GNAT superfamily N-acetyltransferase